MLNPGVVYRNGAYQMLYRADGGGPDQIGHATSTDGLHFTRDAANPVIQDNVLPYESGGVTDPRLYELNGTYYSFVAAYDWSNSPPQTIMETTSTDLVHWTTAVPIVHTNYDPAVVTDGNDTPVLMNTQYGPRYVMYYGDGDPAKGRFIAYSTDMKTWTNNTADRHALPLELQPVGDLRDGHELPDRLGRAGQPQHRDVRGRDPDGARPLVLRRQRGRVLRHQPDPADRPAHRGGR